MSVSIYQKRAVNSQLGLKVYVYIIGLDTLQLTFGKSILLDNYMSADHRIQLINSGDYRLKLQVLDIAEKKKKGKHGLDQAQSPRQLQNHSR